MLLEASLADIVIGERHRHEGLLQPIGITEDRWLVFGERRVKAAQMLGWTSIAARVVDLPSIVAGEYSENEIRQGRDPLAPLQDVINDEGDIIVPVDPRYLGLWLTGLFGN